MTPKQIELVQHSFRKVLPIADAAADMFYARMIELDPALAKLFKGTDMKEQGGMLMAMLACAVRGLNEPNALIPVLTALGRRHAGYGVMDAHYATGGEALLWTLEKGLGEDQFDDETRKAWAAAYMLVATVMQQGARDTQRVAIAA